MALPAGEASGSRGTRKKCFWCAKTGHIAAECKSRLGGNDPAPNSRQGKKNAAAAARGTRSAAIEGKAADGDEGDDADSDLGDPVGLATAAEPPLPASPPPPPPPPTELPHPYGPDGGAAEGEPGIETPPAVTHAVAIFGSAASSARGRSGEVAGRAPDKGACVYVGNLPPMVADDSSDGPSGVDADADTRASTPAAVAAPSAAPTGGTPTLTTSAVRDVLWELFAQVGPVVSVMVPSDPATGRGKGFAFVEFTGIESVYYACFVMNTLELFGRPLRVKSRGEDEREQDARGHVHIRGLSDLADEAVLIDVLSGCPGLVGARVMRDDGGASRGFGFAALETEGQARLATAAISGIPLFGRALELSLSHRMRKVGDGGGGSNIGGDGVAGAGGAAAAMTAADTPPAEPSPAAVARVRDAAVEAAFRHSSMVNPALRREDLVAAVAARHAPAMQYHPGGAVHRGMHGHPHQHSPFGGAHAPGMLGSPPMMPMHMPYGFSYGAGGAMGTPPGHGGMMPPMPPMPHPYAQQYGALPPHADDL